VDANRPEQDAAWWAVFAANQQRREQAHRDAAAIGARGDFRVGVDHARTL